ncbi:MAG: MFS transporter [Rhodospirillales bacterium]|nr:MFS transporter [Alphaproteobacteria bacterium]MBL6948992.1 MFS transporter [Rhodospirillales bacterium]
MNATPSTGWGRFSWCLYDWANSAFPTVITTFVFSAYFTKAIAADEIAGTSQWGWALSLSGLAVAVAAPLLGAIADFGGRRKPWIFVFTGLCAVLTGLLWNAKPDVAFVLLALVLAGAANFAFEMAMVFYNAMLPDLTTRDRIGRLSGWGWGLGYAGGLACLGLALVALVDAEVPVFGLDKETSEHLRAMGPMVALWMVVFAVPLFLWTPDTPSRGLAAGEAVRQGWAALKDTVRRVREFRSIVRYLIARMLYIDGLNTLFAFGGIYAAGTFGMDFSELIIFGIAINVTAGLGAAGFAWVDDWIGPKRTIQIAVTGLMVLGGALLVVEGKTLFWVFALPLGIFVGPAQAASRSMMAHMAPADMRTEMFGLFALSGKATAFLGPALLAWVTALFESQRAGMATILVFFAAGLALLAGVPDQRGENAPPPPVDH